MSTSHGFAFLCMYKCASTSIEEAIRKFCNIIWAGPPGSGGMKHMNAKLFSETVLVAHKTQHPSLKIESLCVIRDPLEWIESWYRFRSREVLKNPEHRNHKRYTGNMSYSEFIQEYISVEERKPFANLGTQFEFMKLDDGQIGVDHVFPMDNLNLVSVFLSDKIGQEIKFPHINASPEIKTSLEPDLELKLRKHLEKDLTIYKFVKENGYFNKALHSDSLSALLRE